MAEVHLPSLELQLLGGPDNNDENRDIVTADYTSKRLAVSLGNGAGKFQSPVIFDLADHPQGGVAVGDFNGDGKPDVAVSVAGRKVAIFLNTTQ